MGLLMAVFELLLVASWFFVLLWTFLTLFLCGSAGVSLPLRTGNHRLEALTNGLVGVVGIVFFCLWQCLGRSFCIVVFRNKGLGSSMLNC